jgi:diguanylate cyclase (GGDEF)-like protein
VLCVAAAVLFSSETQRHAADRNFQEATASQSLLADFLDQERAFSDYLITGRADALTDYLTGGGRVSAELDQASKVSKDDKREVATIVRQRSAWETWQTLANGELAARDRQIDSKRAAVLRRDRLVDAYTAANQDYGVRLAAVRSIEEGQAALVAVWLTLGLSAVFVSIGAGLMFRARRRERQRRASRAAERTAQEAFVSSQARFGEALQVTTSQSEAHRLLIRHVETAIPNSVGMAFNRNNSANRLEPTVAIDQSDPLWERLRDAEPRSCLAVRLSRRYERGPDAQEIVDCEICGGLPRAASSCQPLLVGGEVIGSVLVSMDDTPTDADRRRIDESVVQAAPVLANLRNLALAERRAATDSLTGLPNKRALDDSIKQMAAQAGRTASPLSIIFLDLDHFKRINDTHGHDRGDEVLAAVGALLRHELRASDVPGRMGGEEFLILLPATDGRGAMTIAEKLRLAIHDLEIRGLEHAITASLGVATLPDDAADTDTLIRTADRALYAAKQLGRDRVQSPSDEVAPAAPVPA